MNDNLYKLKIRQAYPLWIKLHFTKLRIRQWYEYWEGQVYVSFSGGKDSTVLLDIVRSMYPDVAAVFVNTGLEYPEIVSFVNRCDNVTTIRPKMTFKAVIEKYGFPVVSKEQAKYIREVQRGTTNYTYEKRLHGKNGTRTGMISKKWQFLGLEKPFKVSEQCCDVMKKRPLHQYFRQTGLRPFVGTMAGESALRSQKYQRTQCNAFEGKTPMSMPLSFWTESDIWEYISGNKLPYSEIYNMGEDRTGCMWCMFGVHLEASPNRFQRMEKNHPKQHKYCMEKLGLSDVLETIRVEWRNTQKKMSSMV